MLRMLQYYGLISCPSADEALRNDRQISLVQAVSLRAAAIVICQKIVETAATMDGYDWIDNEVDLDNYLWKVAKEDNLRALPRYSFQDTWFF